MGAFKGYCLGNRLEKREHKFNREGEEDERDGNLCEEEHIRCVVGKLSKCCL
jgi:hypothetical protein